MGKSVIDPRAARIIGIGQLDAGRQGGRDNVTITVHPAMRAVMDTLSQGLRDALPAQAMLGQRGGSGGGPIQAATGGLALEGQGRDEHAGAE